MLRVNLHIVSGEGRPGVARGFQEYDRFAAAVAARAGTAVLITEGTIDEIPAEGFVLLHSDAGYAQLLQILSEVRRASLLRRLVPLPVLRGEMLDFLSRFPTAALIEYGGYARWRASPTPRDTWSGLVGLRPIVEEMGLGQEFLGSAYAMVDGRKGSLPELLVTYLQAYAAVESFGEVC